MTDLNTAFLALMSDLDQIAGDVEGDLDEILREGAEQPLSREETHALLGRIVEVMRGRATARGDAMTATALSIDLEGLIDRAETLRLALAPHARASRRVVDLRTHNGIEPRHVRPTPVFHERRVPVVEGFVRTRDIELWGENQRIDIHLNQFQDEHGRRPNPDELLSIMLGSITLPGLSDEDHFDIQGLARSIAANGVRKPPIIDREGNLLDGNRRVTACYYILQSDSFDHDQKQRAEWIQVWQLTDHATDDDREAVIVSLNFEPDHKQDWPEYVKAGKVYEQWLAMVAYEGRAITSPARQKQIRIEIARQFAITPEKVKRYIDMVELANEFEDYQVEERKRDRFAVKHKTEKYFQYFDELKKGPNNGVQQALREDEAFRNMVYDLLYEGKFKNWTQIRQLRAVANNEEARVYMREALETKGVTEGQQKVETAIAVAQTEREMERVVTANRRVEIFTKWLENAPVRIFRPGSADSLTRENLGRLFGALQLVEHYLHPSLLPVENDAE